MGVLPSSVAFLQGDRFPFAPRPGELRGGSFPFAPRPGELRGDFPIPRVKMDSVTVATAVHSMGT